MPSVLITGAAGFLGRHLLAAAPDWETVVHVHTPESIAEVNRTPGPGVIAGDLTSPECLGAVPEVDAVVHLAGRAGGAPHALYRDNVVATAAVLEWMAVRKTAHLVFASTGAIYDNDGALPSQEDDRPRPLSHYAASKLAAEMAVRQASVDAGGALRATILRFPHVYGPGNRKGVVWLFVDSAVRTGKVLLDGEGAQERDLLYVTDAVAAIRAAVRARLQGCVALNVGTGRKIPLRGLPVLISGALGRTVEAAPSGRPEAPPRRIWLNPSAAREMLGWSAQVPLSQGLREIIRWRKTLDRS